MKKMDWQQEFVQLCLQTMRMEDYGDKQKRVCHNRAVGKLEKLKKQIGREAEPQLRELLNHEDSRVRIYGASACMELGILPEKTVEVLRSVIVNEKDTTLKFSASMLLKQCMED